MPLKLLEEQQGLCCRRYPDFDEKVVGDIEHAECPYIDDKFKLDPPLAVNPTAVLSTPNWSDAEHPLAEIDPCPEDDYDCYHFEISTSVIPTKHEISQLGGYPVWVQGDHTPLCPICGRRSLFVAAIGSHDTDVIWGDSGYWYFFACNVTDECFGLAKPLMVYDCL
jgi:hypothetical protein